MFKLVNMISRARDGLGQTTVSTGSCNLGLGTSLVGVLEFPAEQVNIPAGMY